MVAPCARLFSPKKLVTALIGVGLIGLPAGLLAQQTTSPTTATPPLYLLNDALRQYLGGLTQVETSQHYGTTLTLGLQGPLGKNASALASARFGPGQQGLMAGLGKIGIGQQYLPQGGSAKLLGLRYHRTQSRDTDLADTSLVAETPVKPATPACTASDTANTIACGSLDSATLEVSTNSGAAWTAFSAAAIYTGNPNQYPNTIGSISAVAATVGSAGSRPLPATTDPDGNSLSYAIVGTLPAGRSASVSGSGNSRTLGLAKTINDVAPVASGAFAGLANMTVSHQAGFAPIIDISAGGDMIENVTVTVRASNGSRAIQKTFVRSIRDDG